LLGLVAVMRTVGMVEPRARWVRIKPAHKGFTGFNRGLRVSRNPVQLIGQVYAVPVRRGRYRQVVCEVDPNSIALGHPDLRPGELAVVPPRLDNMPIAVVPTNRLGSQIELLDPVLGYAI